MTRKTEQELQTELSSAYKELKATLTDLFNRAVEEAWSIAEDEPGASAGNVLYLQGIKPEHVNAIIQPDHSPDFRKLRDAALHHWMKVSMSASKYGETPQQFSFLEKLKRNDFKGWERRAVIRGLNDITGFLQKDMKDPDKSAILSAKAILSLVKTGPVIH